MWALGEIVFNMLTKEPAFVDDLALQKYARNPKAYFPSQKLRKFSTLAQEFIKSLMDPIPDSRLPSCIAIEHAWLGGQSSLDTRVPTFQTPRQVTAGLAQG